MSLSFWEIATKERNTLIAITGSLLLNCSITPFTIEVSADGGKRFCFVYISTVPEKSLSIIAKKPLISWFSFSESLTPGFLRLSMPIMPMTDEDFFHKTKVMKNESGQYIILRKKIIVRNSKRSPFFINHKINHHELKSRSTN